MFLKHLNTDEEKIAFLELAHALIPLDNQFSEFEKNLINDFKFEMSFDKDFEPWNIKNIEDINPFLDVLKNREKEVLIGLLIELVALAKINMEYSEKEMEFINYIANYWNLKEKLPYIEDWVEQYLNLIRDLNYIFS